MKNWYSVAVVALFLASAPTLFPDSCSPCSDQQESYCCPTNQPHRYVRLRSQASNTARQLVGWQELINTLPENPEKKVYGAFASTVEYQRSFDSRAIADYLLGCPTLSFKGSQVANRNNSRDLVADYFGLPTDFKGKLTIAPVIGGSMSMLLSMIRTIQRISLAAIYTLFQRLLLCAKDYRVKRLVK